MVVVEAAIDEGVFGQAAGRFGGALAYDALAVIHLVAIGQVQRLLGKKRCELGGDDKAVGQHIVNAGQGGGAYKAQVGNLHGRRAVGQNIGPHAQGQAVQVDEDVDLMAAYALRGLLVAHRPNLDVVVHGRHHPRSQGAAVFAAPAKAIHLYPCAVMQLQQFGNEYGHRVGAKIRRQVANAQALVAIAAFLRERSHA